MTFEVYYLSLGALMFLANDIIVANFNELNILPPESCWASISTIPSVSVNGGISALKRFFVDVEEIVYPCSVSF